MEDLCFQIEDRFQGKRHRKEKRFKTKQNIRQLIANLAMFMFPYNLYVKTDRFETSLNELKDIIKFLEECERTRHGKINIFDLQTYLLSSETVYMLKNPNPQESSPSKFIRYLYYMYNNVIGLKQIINLYPTEIGSECPTCFTENVKTTSKCGHTICRFCVDQIMKTSLMFKCPYCRSSDQESSFIIDSKKSIKAFSKYDFDNLCNLTYRFIKEGKIYKHSHHSLVYMAKNLGMRIDHVDCASVQFYEHLCRKMIENDSDEDPYSYLPYLFDCEE